MRIRIEIDVDNVTDFRDAVAALAGDKPPPFDFPTDIPFISQPDLPIIGGGDLPDLPTLPEVPPAEPVAEPPKRGRGRPKKAPNGDAASAEPVPELPPATDTLPDEPELPLTGEPETDPLAADPTEGAIPQTPQEMKVKGRAVLLDLMQRDSTKKQQIQMLATKYGVKTFFDIPDVKAGEFLAEAMMMAGGSEAH